MSIRLRLTLLYSGILALTLLLFGGGAYGIQARATLLDMENKLAGAGHVLEFLDRVPPAELPNVPAPRIPRNRFPSQPYWSVLDENGTVLRADPNLDNVSLTISVAERENVLHGTGSSLEIISTENERFLVFNQRVRLGDGSTAIAQVALSLAERDRFLQRLARMLLLGGGLVVLLAFAVGWWLAGYALRPIDRLTQTAYEIGEAQDISRRVDYRGPPDEIGRLARTFNLMLERLQTAFQQKDSALQRQKQFVADASHELRTPLTTIRGNLGLLQHEPPLDADEQADVVGDMVDETERLMRLVHNLLALARADAGAALQLSAVPLATVAEDVCRQAQFLSPERQIICQIDPALKVQANPDALKQVLLALVDNAIKHTENTAEIRVNATREGNQVRIAVRDTGAGMSAEQAEHVFDRFYRGDGARSRGGAGLGLSIAKELVEAQNGKITVQSSVGQGTIFFVTLAAAI